MNEFGVGPLQLVYIKIKQPILNKCFLKFKVSIQISNNIWQLVKKLFYEVISAPFVIW